MRSVIVKVNKVDVGRPWKRSWDCLEGRGAQIHLLLKRETSYDFMHLAFQRLLQLGEE